MQKRSLLIILFLIIAILFLTNPDTNDYAQWTTDKIKNTENPISSFLTGTIGESFIKESASRKNYYIFSVFEFDDKKTLGILNIFFPLDYSFSK